MSTKLDEFGRPVVDTGPRHAPPNDPNREFFGEQSRETIRRNRERAERQISDALGRAPSREAYAFDDAGLALHPDDRELVGLPPLTADQRATRALALHGGFLPDLPAGFAAEHLTEQDRRRLAAGYTVKSTAANRYR